MAARSTPSGETAETDRTVEDLHAKRDARDDLQDLRAQIETIRTDIGALADLLGEIGGRRKTEASQSLQDKLDALKLRAELGGEAMSDQVEAVSAKARDAVREQPGVVLAIATGIGFLAGLLMSRR